ncbi:Non-specific serine/threonine protein kinase [Psidium guajava]|nr:Non-specific serine/threonine protein kinase [Psidium guajava]
MAMELELHRRWPPLSLSPDLSVPAVELERKARGRHGCGAPARTPWPWPPRALGSSSTAVADVFSELRGRHGCRARQLEVRGHGGGRDLWARAPRPWWPELVKSAYRRRRS